MGEELTRERVRLARRMRQQLWRYYPQFLAAVGDDVAAPWALDLWRHLPTPRAGQRARGVTLTKVLKQHRIKRTDAATLRERLREPAVKLAPGTVEAATTHVRLLVERLALLNRQLHHADQQLDRLVQKLAEAAPVDGPDTSAEDDPESPAEVPDAAVLRSLPGVGTRVLVAAPLEKDWNERLRELDEATREREERRVARDDELSARQVRRMEELAADFASVWDAPATGNADRKRLLRLLVEDVTLTRDAYEVIVALRLRGGKALQLDVDLPRPPGLKRPLCPDTLALLDQTLDTHSDAEAADVLNAAGFRNWRGEPYTRRGVYQLRDRVGMSGHRERQQARLQERGYLTGRAMASQLGIDVSTVREWARRGRLLCERIRAGGKPRPMYKTAPAGRFNDGLVTS